MGYYMEQIGQDFTILAENKSKAFEALKRWEQEVTKELPALSCPRHLGKLPHWKKPWMS